MISGNPGWKGLTGKEHKQYVTIVGSLLKNGGLMWGYTHSFGDLRYMGTPPSFSAMFSKGDNFHDFLFAYLEDKVFQKWGLLLKERICSDGSKFFSVRVDS